MLKKSISLALILLIFSASSCMKSPDELFSKDYNNDLNLEIPEGFDWSMTKSVDAVIEPFDEYNGKLFFKIRIFDEDPSLNSQASPFAVGLANQNEPFMQKVTLPQTATKLYITQNIIDPSGQEYSVASACVDVKDIGNVKLAKSRTVSRGASNISGQTLPEIMGTDFPNTSGYYVIDSDKNAAAFNWKTNCRITKNCTINIENNSFNDCNIYIEPNVHVTFVQSNKGNTCSIGSGSTVYNDGCITVQGSTATLIIENGATLHNNGCINCDLFDFGGNEKNSTYNAHLYKYSSIVCKTLDLAAGHITMDTGSYINTDVLETKQGKEGDITIMSMDSSIPGNMDGYGYAACLVVNSTVSINKPITLKGAENALLYLKCSDDNAKLLNKESYVVSDDDNENGNVNVNIYVPSNGCNDGTGDNKGDKMPTVTYCMEDQYPDKGDFDLNDIVVEITPEYIITNGGDKNKLNIECKICAVGAKKNIAGYVEIAGNGTHLLFDNAHKVMEQPNGTFINTDKSVGRVEPQTVTIYNVLCNKGFELSDMKFFIKAGGANIYSADQGSINPENQVIGGVRLFVKDFKYPLEKVAITEAYSKIANWIESNKTSNTDWFKFPINDKCY